MWLDPTDATPQLQSLQAALQEAFPKCTELSTISDSFKPHLSVGQVSDGWSLLSFSALVSNCHLQPECFHKLGLSGQFRIRCIWYLAALSCSAALKLSKGMELVSCQMQQTIRSSASTVI